jgi:hypothetical protein
MYKRAAVLLRRYGFGSTKAKKRIEACMTTLTLHGCRPTFPTPGRIVKRYHSFIRSLQDAGAEIAVHSYDHIDLKALNPSAACRQLARGAQAFERNGIQVHGFRCPYLSCTEDLAAQLPRGLFSYGSNTAIRWDVIPPMQGNNDKTVFETIDKFYQPLNSHDEVCVPWIRNDTVEIPVCVPDDLQLHDGLGLDSEGIAEVWSQILKQTYERGELFTLIFHPELAGYCDQPFITTLQAARQLRPHTWVAALYEISDWWREKSKFTSGISVSSKGIQISFMCSPSATILAKGLDTEGKGEPWDGAYLRLKARTLDVPVKPRPFIGVASSVPRQVTSFLQDQGYILDLSESASQCAIYLDSAILDKLKTQLELVIWLEESAGPIVRYWRWPDGAKSALSITGDLDALSLLDYVSRPFVR